MIYFSSVLQIATNLSVGFVILRIMFFSKAVLRNLNLNFYFIFFKFYLRLIMLAKPIKLDSRWILHLKLEQRN